MRMSGNAQLVIVFMYVNVIGCGQTVSAPWLVRVNGYGQCVRIQGVASECELMSVASV